MYPTGTSPSAPSRPQRSQSSSTVATTRSTSPRRKLSWSGPAAAWSQSARTALRGARGAPAVPGAPAPLPGPTHQRGAGGGLARWGGAATYLTPPALPGASNPSPANQAPYRNLPGRPPGGPSGQTQQLPQGLPAARAAPTTPPTPLFPSQGRMLSLRTPAPALAPAPGPLPTTRPETLRRHRPAPRPPARAASLTVPPRPPAAAALTPHGTRAQFLTRHTRTHSRTGPSPSPRPGARALRPSRPAQRPHSNCACARRNPRPNPRRNPRRNPPRGHRLQDAPGSGVRPPVPSRAARRARGYLKTDEGKPQKAHSVTESGPRSQSQSKGGTGSPGDKPRVCSRGGTRTRRATSRASIPLASRSGPRVRRAGHRRGDKSVTPPALPPPVGLHDAGGRGLELLGRRQRLGRGAALHQSQHAHGRGQPAGRSPGGEDTGSQRSPAFSKGPKNPGLRRWEEVRRGPLRSS